MIRRMVNVRNKEGDNFVFQAIKMNKLHIVGLLLQHPGIEFLDSEDRNIVQFAIEKWIADRKTEGFKECLRAFNENPTVRRMLNTKNKEGNPPTIQLLRHGRVDLVNILLESPNIDLDVRD